LTAVWNGQFGGSVQQGDYTVAATFTDQFANAATTPSINTFVDTVAPTTSTVGDAAFSGHPNGSLDHWTLTFTTGVTTVRTFTGTGTSVDVTWDGANDAGQTVGDAVYTATLTAIDGAGNSATQSYTVVVLTHSPTITLTSNTPTIYGQNIALTASVNLPANTPTSITDLLIGDTVEFFKDPGTELGTGTIAKVGSLYQA